MGSFFSQIADLSWERFWNEGVVGVLEASPALREFFLGTVQDVVPSVLTFGITAFMEVTSAIGRIIGDAVDKYEAQSGFQMIEMAATGLSDFFGVPISLSAVGLSGGKRIRREVSDQIGRLVLDQMLEAVGSSGKLSPEKGRQSAESVIGFSVSNALEGWVQGALTHPFIERFFPNFAELDTVMSEALGLGRLTNRALAPIIDSAVITPFTWDVNTRFRPTIASPNDTVKGWIQGWLSEPAYFERMARWGFSTEEAANMKILKGRFPFKEDISRMQRLGMLDKAAAVTALRERGFLPEAAELLAEVGERLGEDRARQRVIAVAGDMFRDLEIDEAQYRSLMTGAGAFPPEIEARITLGQLERSRPRAVPRSVMESAFINEAIGLEQLRDYYIAEGFNPEGALILEKEALRRKETTATKRQEREAKLLAQEQAEQEREADRARAPRSVFEGNFIRGFIRERELRDFYEAEGFDRESIDVLMELAEARKQAFDEREAKKNAPN